MPAERRSEQSTDSEAIAAIRIILLTFPSHVTVLFGLIAVTLIVTLLAGFENLTAACALPLLIVGILLPIRDMLTWVDDARVRFRTKPDLALQQEVNILAATLGIRPPRIERSPELLGIFTVGGLRRSMIIGGDALLEVFRRHLANPDSPEAESVRVILFHELQHVCRGDLRLLGYADRLLATFAKWALWTFVVAVGFVLMLGIVAPEMIARALAPDFVSSLGATLPGSESLLRDVLPAQDEFGRMRDAASRINYSALLTALISTLAPFALVSAGLRLSTWRRLLRVREFYADAATAQRFGTTVVERALDDYSVWQIALSERVATGALAHLAQRLRAWRTRPEAQLAFHPRLSQRRRALSDPLNSVFDVIPSGLTVGGTALLMTVVLSGGFAVLSAGQWPAHAGVAVILMGVNTLSAPGTAGLEAKASRLNALRCGAVALLVWSWYPLANVATAAVGLAISPADVVRMAEMFIGVLMRVPAPFLAADGAELLWSGVVALLISTLTGCVLVFCGIELDQRVKRMLWSRMPVWQGRPRVGDMARLGWWVTSAITSAMLGVLYVVSAFAQGRPEQLLSLGPASAALTLVTSTVLLVRYIRIQPLEGD